MSAKQNTSFAPKARQSIEKLAASEKAAQVAVHVQHTANTTLASLENVEPAVLFNVLCALKVWSYLYLAGDQAANAAWLQLSRETAKAKAIHESGLRAADLPDAVVRGQVVKATLKRFILPKPTSRRGRSRPVGQTEATRKKMIVASALIKSGFPIKTALSIAKLSSGTYYNQPIED